MAEVMESTPLSGRFPGEGTKDEGKSCQLAHFHLFKDMSPELRQRVWKICLPRRIFNFFYGRGPWGPLAPTIRDDFGKKPGALPLIAFVCKEAYYISKLFVREFEMNFTAVVSGRYRYGTTRIRFDLDLDTLVVNHLVHTLSGEQRDADEVDHDDYLHNLHNGPFTLAMKPDVNTIIRMDHLVGPMGIMWFSFTRSSAARSYWDYLTQRSHCTVLLASTGFFAKEQEIRSSGLFGMFGEERSVFVDINDKARIEQFESYIRQLELRRTGSDVSGNHDECRYSYFPEVELAGGITIPPRGSGRYGSCARAFEFGRTNVYDDATREATGAAGLHTGSQAEMDAAHALSLIKQSWLETNHCFSPPNNPPVPWTGSLVWRKWDDEHHVAKHWLRKLPTFSFVAMYQVTELEESTREHVVRFS